MHLDESVHPCCFIFTQAATYPPACFSLRVANYSEWWYQMLKYSNSCVSLKVESCDSPVLIQRQCWTVPSRLRVCHYLSLPNSPLFPLHGYLCRDKPCCIVVGHDSCKTGAKRKPFTATLWKVHPGKHVLEISDLKCLYRCVGTVYGATESLNTSCAPSHSMAQWLAGTHWGGVRVGVWKWRNIKCKSCEFTHGNLPFPTVDKTCFLHLVIDYMMPHLLELGRYYVERPGRARKCIKGVAGSPYLMCWNVPRLAFGVGHHDLRQ